MVATNKNSKKSPKIIVSSCAYFYQFQIARALVSKERRPCTNRPVSCLVCQRVVWSYNIKIHYDLHHSKSISLETCYPTDAEIEQVVGPKQKKANLQRRSLLLTKSKKVTN